MDLTKLSQEYLLAVKKGEPTDTYVDQFSEIPLKFLKEQLVDDDCKKAYWINMYNACYQVLRHKNYTKPKIFKRRILTLHKKPFSLDDMEHGILRKYRYKYSLGFIPSLFLKRRIQTLEVDQIDYRIHFALNCGAASCPPIAFYDPERWMLNETSLLSLF